MGDESRRHLRVIRHGAATLATASGQPVVIDLQDMSLGGMRFKASQKLEPGELVRGDVVLPGGRHFPIEGKIIYRRSSAPYFYGLAFTGDVEERLVKLELGDL